VPREFLGQFTGRITAQFCIEEDKQFLRSYGIAAFNSLQLDGYIAHVVSNVLTPEISTRIAIGRAAAGLQHQDIRVDICTALTFCRGFLEDGCEKWWPKRIEMTSP
jgi:hypothetical protein